MNKLTILPGWYYSLHVLSAVLILSPTVHPPLLLRSQVTSPVTKQQQQTNKRLKKSSKLSDVMMPAGILSICCNLPTSHTQVQVQLASALSPVTTISVHVSPGTSKRTGRQRTQMLLRHLTLVHLTITWKGEPQSIRLLHYTSIYY